MSRRSITSSDAAWREVFARVAAHGRAGYNSALSRLKGTKRKFCSWQQRNPRKRPPRPPRRPASRPRRQPSRSRLPRNPWRRRPQRRSRWRRNPPPSPPRKPSRRSPSPRSRLRRSLSRRKSSRRSPRPRNRRRSRCRQEARCQAGCGQEARRAACDQDRADRETGQAALATPAPAAPRWPSLSPKPAGKAAASSKTAAAERPAVTPRPRPIGKVAVAVAARPSAPVPKGKVKVVPYKTDDNHWSTHHSERLQAVVGRGIHEHVAARVFPPAAG